MLKRNSYKNWVLCFLCTFASVTGLVMAINYAVDPMWCFNHATPFAEWREFIDERQQKTNLLRFRDFEIDTLIMGSSRVMGAKTLPQEAANSFNLGVSSCIALEYESLLKIFYNARKCYPKTILLGIDFFGASKVYPDGNRENKSKTSLDSFDASQIMYKFETIATIELCRKSVNLISKNLDGDVSYGDVTYVTGHMEATSYYPRLTDLQSKRISYHNTYMDFKKTYEIFTYDTLYKKHLGHFTKLPDTTKVIPFITPEGTPFLRLIAETPGRIDDYERMLRDVVDVFGGVWNFMYVNQVTADHTLWREPSHHLPQVDEWIMEKLAGNDIEISDFGIYVTSDNIDEHIKMVRKQIMSLPQKRDSWSSIIENDAAE